MATTTPAAALLDATRFVHAWHRFRAQACTENGDVETAKLLRQYCNMAGTLQQTAQRNQTDAEWHKLYDALRQIVDESNSLYKSSTHAQQLDDAAARVRIPRASELLLLKQQRATATAAAAASVRLSLPSPSPSPRVSSADVDVPTRSRQNTLESVAAAPPPAIQAENVHATLEQPSVAPQPEKLSLQALRQRIGLTDRHAANAQTTATTSASATAVREEHEALQSDIVSLARELKERTQSINATLVEDVKILDAVGQSAESNAALLDRENTVLAKQLASAIGLWTSLGLVGAVVIVFVVMYLYMKLFSRRQW